MDVFKRALDSIRQMWGQLNASKRTIVAALAVAVVLVLVWGSVASTSDGMVRVVGHEVDDEKRGDILAKLQQKNEKYEVRDKDIYLPRETADRVVLELAGEGVMSDRAVWQWLESDNIMAPKWQLEKRYQVALSRKLEIMIRHIEFVRNARVLLTPASEAQLIGFKGPKATASVQIELHSGKTLSRGNVAAIAGLVARAVPELDHDLVVITDTRGNSYRAPREGENVAVGGFLRDLEARLEEDIKAKILELFRDASVAVRVVVKTIDVHTIDKKFGKHGVPKMEEERQRVRKSEPGEGPGGIKGEKQLSPEGAQSSGGNEKETTLHTENLVDEIIKDMKDPAGSIEKITIGVLIPQDPDDRNKMPLEVAKSLIAKAAAIPLDDNLLAVHFIPTKKPEAIPPAPAPSWTEWFSANGAIIGLALLGLLLLFWVLRAAMPKGTVEEIQALASQLAPGSEMEAQQAVLAEADNVVRVKQGIQEVISRNPAGAAAGIKQWMSESR